ncbi:CU044_5270 family protein [Nonomuraea monospora]|uniref:CU044_5270 family protein n=1 Tax=Nonomuraea monospora TaxID=568818 RepID=UPI0031D3CD3B
MDDDLTLLRELRADAPEPDAERLNALRTRVLDTRVLDTRVLDTRVLDTRVLDTRVPGGRVSGGRGIRPDGRWSPRLRAVRVRAVRVRAVRVRAVRVRAVRWRGLWLAPSVLAVVTAVAALFVILNGAAHRVPQPVTAVRTTPIDSPRAMLLQAALMAERRQASGPPRDDQWLYRRVATRQPGDTERTTQEYWTRYDGTEQVVRQNGGAMQRHRIEPDPDDDDLTPKEYAAKLAALPTDPARLLAHVRADRHWSAKPEGEKPGEHPDARVFRVLSVYLEEEVTMPPEQEAAIFRALAGIPGIRVDHGVPDAVGRQGIGIAYDLGAQHDAEGQLVSRSYLVLDPTTYEFLGRRVENLQDDVLDGELLARKGTYYATAELAAGVVDQPGLVP